MALPWMLLAPTGAPVTERHKWVLVWVLPDSINQGGTARALLVLGFTKTRRALFYVLGTLSLGSVPAGIDCSSISTTSSHADDADGSIYVIIGLRAYSAVFL